MQDLSTYLDVLPTHRDRHKDLVRPLITSETKTTQPDANPRRLCEGAHIWAGAAWCGTLLRDPFTNKKTLFDLRKRL